MMTGPSVGPGMLLTVLMRWPALIAVLAVGGGAFYGYKEYGLPEQVESALLEWRGEKAVVQASISDSNKAKGVDHLAEAKSPVPVAVAASAPVAPASAPEPVAVLPPVIVVPQKEPESEAPPVSEKYTVVEGDHLTKIAARRSSDKAVQRALVARMIHDNPNAFTNNDPHRLEVGTVLILPPK